MEELELAKHLAKKAGAKIMEYYKEGFAVRRKENKTPVTEADEHADKIIIQGIQKHYPDDGMLTEESEDDLTRLNKNRVWIVDPIDGTKEFINGNGEFTVNIALVENGRPIAAAIYVPAHDQLYYAKKGAGAHLETKDDKKRIQVKHTTKDLVGVKSRSHASPALQKLYDELDVEAIESHGSSVKGCLVAAGKADVYIRLGNQHEWDVCAMDLIIYEAGGEMTCLDTKQPRTYNQKNTLLHGFVLANETIVEKTLSN